MLKAQAGFHGWCTAEEQHVQLELVASSGITVISVRAHPEDVMLVHPAHLLTISFAIQGNMT